MADNAHMATGTASLETQSKHLERYGLIGNMVSAALVADDGSIDWLCAPRFDSPACFAALLGTRENGLWRISPAAKNWTSSQRYIPDTAVLETHFETASGAAILTDFMPIDESGEERVDVVRIVRCVRGEISMEMELLIRFNYGQSLPWVRRRDYGMSAIAGPDAVEIHTRLDLEGRDMATFSEFTLREGDARSVTMSYHRSHRHPHFVPDHNVALDHTLNWWKEWIGRCSFSASVPHWYDAVRRSLITLKLLTFAPTGGVAAAPTTSLPETIGGTRNWDYRYCWLRDSALTLTALLKSGYRSEAEAWRQWVRRATAGHPRQIQIMYGLAGERRLPENTIPWLPGYEGSSPVRVGNGAAGQIQMDIYGELAETLYLARQGGLGPMSASGNFQPVVLDYLASNWQTLDQGIWEVRGPPRAFTHSRMMCWAAFDRSVKMSEQFSMRGDIENWRKLAKTIHDEVCDQGFNKDRNAFTQYYGGTSLDASVLQMFTYDFLPGDDPRMVGTIKAIEDELLDDGFVLRYSTEEVDDGVGGREGAFLACSFWLADAYVLSGRREEGIDLFEKLLSLRNGLGLLAEEYDTVAKRLVGNYPQGFSHLGLINTAHYLMGTTLKQV